MRKLISITLCVAALAVSGCSAATKFLQPSLSAAMAEAVVEELAVPKCREAGASKDGALILTGVSTVRAAAQACEVAITEGMTPAAQP